MALIILRSSDEEPFEVEESVAKQSITIKNLIDDDAYAGGIPLPNVDSRTLRQVLDFCKSQAAAAPDAEPLPEFTKKYEDMLKTDQHLFFDLTLAANYLNITKLLDLLTLTTANAMRGKTTLQIRKLFHIKNDYTEEEEKEVRNENAWAFDEQ